MKGFPSGTLLLFLFAIGFLLLSLLQSIADLLLDLNSLHCDQHLEVLTLVLNEQRESYLHSLYLFLDI